MMPFSLTIRERALLAYKRRCCLCEEHVHTLVECHHIVQEADGGDSSFDNCIPLCLNCHGRVASYNPRHPIENQYSEKELKQRRNNFYAQMNPTTLGVSHIGQNLNRQSTIKASLSKKSTDSLPSVFIKTRF